MNICMRYDLQGGTRNDAPHLKQRFPVDLEHWILPLDLYLGIYRMMIHHKKESLLSCQWLATTLLEDFSTFEQDACTGDMGCISEHHNCMSIEVVVCHKNAL